MTDGDLERRDLLRGVAGAATAPFFVNSVAGQQAPDEGPAGVHAAYGRDPASTLRIGWSGAPAAEARVEIGRPDEPKTTVTAEANPLPGQEAVAYAATVTGLASGATYEYEAVLDGRRAGPFEIETAPDDTDGFVVTAVSDHGIADPENAFQRPDDRNPDEVMAVAQSLDSDLQILAGDISYANGVPSTWELYFDTFEDFFARTPFMTAAGNHEAEPGTALIQYDRRLNDLMPIDDPLSPDDTQHEQRWYHFDYDNTRFVALSTSTDGCGDVSRGEEFVPIYDPRCEAGGVTYGDVQDEYLRNVLEDAVADDDVTWKIVYFHGPLWTDSPDHAPRDLLRDRWGTIFDEYGVDLAFCGDNHVWERTKPIKARPGRDDYAPASAWEYDETDLGTTYLTNGTGGVSHYGFGNRQPGDYLARRTNNHYGVERLDITDERIRVEYVTTDSLDGDGLGDELVVRDSFEIRKADERTDAGARRPRQTSDYDGPIEDDVVVQGGRDDDGSVFTAGQTNRVTLTYDATREVEIRDRLPASWDVEGGDAVRTDDGAPGDTQWVYFDESNGSGTSGTVNYFVEVPTGAGDTGRYTLGPSQARDVENGKSGDEWLDVPGTESRETVVGVET
ncbi:hypothetical protein BRC88_10915 [Halobacteriales archaeon QS_4_69_225]|nr:MAG: hypothetical protein BRC88_10915 [Halobacteriales archaeon QS_4_69_225]